MVALTSHTLLFCMSTGIKPCFIVAGFIVLRRYCFFFFTNRRFMATALGKSVGAIFPTAFAHFRSVSHFGNSPTVCVMVACGQ